MKKFIPLLITIGIVLIINNTSCEYNDYDFGPIHNHPPRIEVRNMKADSLYLFVYKDEMIMTKTLQPNWARLHQYGETKTVIVEPNKYKIYLTDKSYKTVTDTVKLIIRKGREYKHSGCIIFYETN